MTGQFAARYEVRHPALASCGLAFDIVHSFEGRLGIKD